MDLLPHLRKAAVVRVDRGGVLSQGCRRALKAVHLRGADKMTLGSCHEECRRNLKTELQTLATFSRA